METLTCVPTYNKNSLPLSLKVSNEYAYKLVDFIRIGSSQSYSAKSFPEQEKDTVWVLKSKSTPKHQQTIAYFSNNVHIQ